MGLISQAKMLWTFPIRTWMTIRLITPPPPEIGNSGQSKATSTPRQDADGSDKTMDVQPSPRDGRHQRPGSVREGRRSSSREGEAGSHPYRIVIAETTTTAYRKYWEGDDGLSALQGDEGMWPVYHGRSFNLWEPDTGDYYDSCDSSVMSDLLQSRRQEPSSASPHAGFSTTHLANPASLPCRQPRIAIRDITNPTNTRTLIAAMVPGGRIFTQHAAFVLLAEAAEPRDEAFAIGVLASMICDWQSRRRVELHMANMETLGGLSMPLRRNDAISDRIIEIAGRLSARDDRFESWATQVGVPVRSIDENEQADLVAELDAQVAILYGLDLDDLRLLFGTFADSRQWGSRRDAVIKHFIGATRSTDEQ